MAKSARQSSLPSILPQIFLPAKMPPRDYFFFVSAPIFASSIQSQLNGRFPHPSSPPNGPMTPKCCAVLRAYNNEEAKHGLAHSFAHFWQQQPHQWGIGQMANRQDAAPPSSHSSHPSKSSNRPKSFAAPQSSFLSHFIHSFCSSFSKSSGSFRPSFIQRQLFPGPIIPHSPNSIRKSSAVKSLLPSFQFPTKNAKYSAANHQKFVCGDRLLDGYASQSCCFCPPHKIMCAAHD